jgi:hypothetical protein
MSVKMVRDLRVLFGNIRDQGSRPTCLAFAVSDAHAASCQPFQPLSVEFLFYYAVQKTAAQNPDTGLTPRSAADALAESGQPIEAVWPYRPVLSADLSSWVPPKTADVFRRELSLRSHSFDEICASLDAGCPVILGLAITHSFHLPNKEGIVEQRAVDPNTGSHAVIAVGHGHTSSEKCLLIRNSWGSGWGIDGYGFIEEGYLKGRLLLSSVIGKKI